MDDWNIFTYLLTMTSGRPTKYQDIFDAQAHKLALLGATDKEMAEFFEVNQDTIYEWQKKHARFSESIKEGKLKADATVAHKLYDKAIGPEWIEEQAFKLKEKYYDENGKIVEKERIEIVQVKRAAPPDTPAISLWLRNRSSDKWKDKVDVNHGGQPGNPLIITQTDAEILAQYLGKK